MTTSRYYLFLDRRAYQGEDANQVYEQPINYGSTNGWHSTNHNRYNVLLFGDTPKELYGERGLMGAIERIVARKQAGLIDFDEINIVKLIGSKDDDL
jgi:hypothetical protein